MSDEGLTTRQKLLSIIEDNESAGSYMTISGVAEEAGRSNSLIHNRYPELAERIRKASGAAKEKDPKIKLAKRRGTIKEEKAKRRRVNNKLTETKKILQKTDSVNAALQLENERLKTLNSNLMKKQISPIKSLAIKDSEGR